MLFSSESQICKYASNSIVKTALIALAQILSVFICTVYFVSSHRDIGDLDNLSDYYLPSILVNLYSALARQHLECYVLFQASRYKRDVDPLDKNL